MTEDFAGKLSSDSAISLHDLISALLERIWILTACLILGVVGGFYKISKTPLTYASSALIKIEPPKQVMDIRKITPEETGNDEATQTMIQLFRTDPFLMGVAQSYHLNQDPLFWGLPEGSVVNHTPLETAQVLKGIINVALHPGSRVIEITVENTNPEMCQRLANAIASGFIEFKKNEGGKTTSTASIYLDEQAAKSKKDLEDTERKLQEFREKNQTVGLDQAEISSINARVADVNRQRLALESDLHQIELNPASPEMLLGLESIASSPSISSMRANIAKYQEKITQMQQRYTEKHPKLIRAHQELLSMKERLKTDALEAVSTVRPRYEAALALEKSLEEVSIARNRIAIEYNSLLSDVQTNRSLYDSILKRRSEGEVLKAEQFDQISVVQQAGYPTFPIKPDKKKIWTMSIGAGLAAGVLIAFAFYFLDNTIKRVEKAEALFKLPVLTVVPESQLKKTERAGAEGLAEVEATVNESFRSLIVALNLLGGPPGCKICLFTSSVPGEGKSFCSFHGAKHLASQGKRTLLIDVDLRRPSLFRLLKQNEDAKGVTDFLTGGSSIAEVIYPSGFENLSYIPAGSRSPNPIKLLADGGFRPLLDAVSSNYDYVVLDTAPINAVSDTLLLAELAHHICLIIHTGKTSIHAVRRTLQMIAKANKQPSGIILNRFLARRGAYYYYSYSYNKTYGPEGVYGRDDDKKNRSTRKLS